MSDLANEVKIIAPVVSIPVEFTMDRMIARDTARRVAGALGFPPATQAQIGSVTLYVADLLLNNAGSYELNFFGVRDNINTGMCLSSPPWWKENGDPTAILAALQAKFSKLVDEVEFQTDQEELVLLTFWQK